MASGFKLTGLDGPNGLGAHLRRLAPRAVSETMDVLRDAGGDVRAAIKPALPRRTGAFQDSGKVSDRGDDSVAVTFDGHYKGQSKATIAAVAKRTAKAAVAARAPDIAARLKVRS